jgi:hypothetical protein
MSGPMPRPMQWCTLDGGERCYSYHLSPAEAGRLRDTYAPATEPAPGEPRTAAGRVLLDHYAPFAREGDPPVQVRSHLTRRAKLAAAVVAIEQAAIPLTVERLAEAIRDSGMSIAFDSDAVPAVAAAVLAALGPASFLEGSAEDPRDVALAKINAIRDSIVGHQQINWSEHIYPLVAALNEAGVKGLEYPEAKANIGTLHDRIEALEGALRRVLVENDKRHPGEKNALAFAMEAARTTLDRTDAP